MRARLPRALSEEFVRELSDDSIFGSKIKPWLGRTCKQSSTGRNKARKKREEERKKENEREEEKEGQGRRQRRKEGR